MAFQKFNINPKGRKTSDCSTRAIAKAAGIDYLEALNLQFEIHKTKGYAYSSTKNIDLVLQQLGFEPQVVRVPRGSGRPKVHEIMHANFYSTLVISVAGHLTCAINNVNYDIWDCRNNPVYKYWIKKED